MRDRAQVIADSLFADSEVPTDLAIGPTPRDIRQDLELTLGQRRLTISARDVRTGRWGPAIPPV
jgi:hypothetical protein